MGNKTVLCSGTRGSGQVEYLERVLTLLKHEEQLNIIDVGKKMEEISEERRKSVPRERFLDTGPMQEMLCGWAFERIKREIDGGPKDAVNVVVAHLSIRRRFALSPGCDVASVKMLKPDMIVNIVDTIGEVQRRLSESNTWARWNDISELIAWREEEILASHLVAAYEDAAFYVIPHSEPRDTLYGLLFRGDLHRIYLSYPITNLMKSERWEEFKPDLEALRDTLRQHYVLFDPLSIKDLQPLPTDIGEADEQSLRAQTVLRDYRLIDQSDFLVVYYPEEARSCGVMAEMRYAKQHGRPVYAVIHETSPFLPEFVDHPFETSEALLEHLQHKHKWEDKHG